MKYVLAFAMLMILACSVFQFWMHDLSGFVVSFGTFAMIRYAIEKLKNDHSQSE